MDDPTSTAPTYTSPYLQRRRRRLDEVETEHGRHGDEDGADLPDLYQRLGNWPYGGVG